MESRLSGGGSQARSAIFRLTLNGESVTVIFPIKNRGFLMNRFFATIYCNLSFSPETRKKRRIRMGLKAGGKGYVNPEGNRIFLIHPSGEKQLIEPFQIPGSVRLNIEGEHNTLIFHAPLSLNNISIHIWKHVRGTNIEFGSSASGHSHWNNVSIQVAASGSALSIGHSTGIAGLTVILAGGKCHIGNDCMMSSGITIWANDTHRLMDAGTGEVLNSQPQGVFIGDHCWIGQGAAFTKNAIIPANTVVGLQSVVTKPFREEFTVLAGNPAKVIKTGVKWSREREME